MESWNRFVVLAKWLIVFCLLLIIVNQDIAMGVSIDKLILDAAPKAEMFDLFHLMPTGELMVMTELDMLMTLEQYKQLYSKADSGRKKRKAKRDETTRWTGCKVYYEIKAPLNTKDTITKIKEAMAEWEKYSCLVFIENDSKQQRIQFKDAEGCYSNVGMQRTPQVIGLASGCISKGIIAHEIGHAIGWYHEHMRPDRDDYIAINLNVISERDQRNFMKYDSTVIDTYNISYDYTSIMHYADTAYRGAITTRDPTYQNKIGQRNGLSFKDIKLANVMYNCARVMFCKNFLQNCTHNGFVFYKDHNNAGACVCMCDSGNVEDPLIPCSSIEVEPPPPNITNNPFLPSTKPCYDVRNDCQERMRQDPNVCMKKMDMMMAFCERTCNFCGKGQNVCMDYQLGCSLIARTGGCIDADFKIQCPASCGVCQAPDPCTMQQLLKDLTDKTSGTNIVFADKFMFLVITMVFGFDL